MPKRSSNASVSSQISVTTRSQKRLKVDETEVNPPNPAEEAKGEPEEIPEENLEDNLEENVEEDLEDTVVPIKRDPEYYFEDGNVTLRVRQVIFKAHSEDFFNKLKPPLDDSTVAGGTCDEDAIVIPDIQPSQLRNLMKIIYCLPSNNVVFGANKAIVGNFDCYLDVAVLSHKFAMEAMQQWAKKQLAELVRESGKLLADQLDDFYDEAGNLCDSIYLDDEYPDSADDAAFYNVFHFVEAIRYAGAVSHHTLLHNMLNILEYYSACPDPDITFFVAFFRIEDLCKTEPSLFGYFFLLLLDHGNQVWIDKVFTQEERMALFSAQSFLTPLPESLKAPVLAPLFTRPTSANEFAAILSEDAKCVAGCHDDIFSRWQKAFPVSYYNDVNSREFSVSIKALTTLPLHRLDFATELCGIKSSTCRRKFLRKLDEDIQGVFARLGEYYKVYD